VKRSIVPSVARSQLQAEDIRADTGVGARETPAQRVGVEEAIAGICTKNSEVRFSRTIRPWRHECRTD